LGRIASTRICPDGKEAEQKAKSEEADSISKSFEGAQSSLNFDKDGRVVAEKSKVSRIKDGAVEHMSKAKVNAAATRLTELYEYTEN